MGGDYCCARAHERIDLSQRNARVAGRGPATDGGEYCGAELYSTPPGNGFADWLMRCGGLIWDPYQILWDGRDDLDEAMATDVNFNRLVTGTVSKARRLLLK